jgi:hypothetical protein
MEEITKANKTTDTHLNSIFEEGLRSPEASEQNRNPDHEWKGWCRMHVLWLDQVHWSKGEEWV